MAKTPTQIFNDKVSLIFEYNKRSPLFVRMANTEIENNNTDRAILILNEGIKLYPRYAAAYFLLGKANTLKGNYSAALKNIKTGSDMIHSKKTYEFYLREIENIKKQRMIFESSSRNAFLPLGETENELAKDAGVKDMEREPSRTEIYPPVEERLSEIARDLSAAKIPEISTEETASSLSSDEIPANNMIFSETLAKIYAAQGEYSEAIGVYRKLIKKNPEKSEYYTQKISDLQKELE